MRTHAILLDTCAVLFLEEGGLREEADQALRAAQDLGVPVCLSPITAWEVGLLVSRGRLALVRSPADWFEGMLKIGLQLAPMPPAVLAASSFLPDSDLRDPADRILAATARTYGYRLMTRDRPLLAFAEAGHMQAIPC